MSGFQCSRYRQFSGRINFTEQYAGQGITAFHTCVPGLYNGLSLLIPGTHINGAAADQYNNGVGIIVVREIRLEKAKELLGKSDLSISQIAYEVGFSKPGYFTEVFVETYGVTPSDYRNV